MEFVLAILYYNQPVQIKNLWDLCRSIPLVPLDSRRHLRQVIHQARLEGWIHFEKTDRIWMAYPTRERYNELKTTVCEWREKWLKQQGSKNYNKNMPCGDTLLSFANRLPASDTDVHYDRIGEQLNRIKPMLNKHEHTKIAYLPYTDPNGKVNFMWWYDSACNTNVPSATFRNNSN